MTESEATTYLAEVAGGIQDGDLFFEVIGAAFIPPDANRIKVFDTVLVFGGTLLEGKVLAPETSGDQREFDLSPQLPPGEKLLGLITSDKKIYYDLRAYGQMSPEKLTEHVKRLHPDMVRAVVTSK